MKGVIDYLEKTAGLFPEKPAVSFMENSYTFSELMHYSRRIGAAIGEFCGAGSAVAVMVNRSAETVAAFLGAVYNGDYYIPIDPGMPAEKIRSILRDSGAKVILGTVNNTNLISGLDYAGVFIDYNSIGLEETEAPSVVADTPLYMVYTSGSTGEPKGVLKSHGSVMSFIRAYTETFGLTEKEVIGNQTPFFFDASAKDLYQMLYTGASLEVIPSEYFMLPTALVEYLNTKRITYICWVPTALSMVVQMNAFNRVKPDTLRNVFFVGEVFPSKQLKKWIEVLPGGRFVNLYGSSEIAGICMYYEINKENVPEILPLGEALSNCEVFILGEKGFINTPGEIGEIVIAGDALALCYFNDRKRTADRFKHMLTPSGTEKRVFMSGDLAKTDSGGNLVFASRSDFQIKYLGKRIELGEIEAVADRLPCIQRCCCVFDQEHQVITLFCELVAGSEENGNTIRKALRPMLSDYMLPKKVVVLEKMPYNANGKINRTLLKAY